MALHARSTTPARLPYAGSHPMQGSAGFVMGDLGLNRSFVFPLDGKLLRSIGRAGRGPGEFRQLDAVVRLRGDSVAAWDNDGTVAVFDPDGRLARARPDLGRRFSYGFMHAVRDEGLFHHQINAPECDLVGGGGGGS